MLTSIPVLNVASIPDISLAIAQQTDISHKSISETAPKDLHIKADGTELYILDSTQQAIVQYTMSTAFNITTATKTGTSISVGASKESFSISTNGLFLVVIETGVLAKLISYTLSTAWDITSATLTTTKDISSDVSSTVIGVRVDSTGTKLMILDDGSSKLRRYTMSTALTLSTATLDAAQIFTIPALSGTSPMFVYDDGKTILIQGSNSGSDTNRTDLTVSFDLTTASSTSNQSTPNTSHEGIFLSTDGLGYIGVRGSSIDSLVLVTPHDVSTSTPNDGGEVLLGGMELEAGGIQSVTLGDSGTKLYATSSYKIYQYNLSVPNDVSSATFASKTLSIFNGDLGTNTGIHFKPDGTRLYVSKTGGDVITSYTLSIAWDITTATIDVGTFDYTAVIGTTNCIALSDAGTSMIIGSGQKNIYTFNLSTPWDISSATLEEDSVGDIPLYTDVHLDKKGRSLYHVSTEAIHNKQLLAGNSTSNIRNSNHYTIEQVNTTYLLKNIVLSEDGTRGIVFSKNSNDMYQSTTTIPFDLTSMVYDNIQTQETTGNRASYDMLFLNGGLTSWGVPVLPGTTIFEYVYTSPYSLESMSDTGKGINIGVTILGISTTNQESILYVMLSTTQIIVLELSIPGDISTGTYDGVNTITLSPAVSGVESIQVIEDNYMYILDTSNTVHEYELATPGDLTTAVLTGVTLDLNNIVGAESQYFSMSTDGTYANITTKESATLVRLPMSTAFDISTIESVSTIWYGATLDSTGITVSDDNKEIITCKRKSVYQYIIP